jgi:hypothetical protein
MQYPSRRRGTEVVLPKLSSGEKPIMIDRQHLAAHIRQPEIQKRILAGYRGAYGLGIKRIDGNQLALSLRIDAASSASLAAFPSSISVDGHLIRINVEKSLSKLRPLSL